MRGNDSEKDVSMREREIRGARFLRELGATTDAAFSQTVPFFDVHPGQSPYEIRMPSLVHLASDSRTFFRKGLVKELDFCSCNFNYLEYVNINYVITLK